MGTLTVEQWKELVLAAFPNAEFEQAEAPEREFSDDWAAYMDASDDTCIGVWTQLADTGKTEWLVGNMVEQAMSDSLLRMEK